MTCSIGNVNLREEWCVCICYCDRCVGLFTCMSLSLRLAALEVSPHALTLSLLRGEKMQDCKGITGILPLNTELSHL